MVSTSDGYNDATTSGNVFGGATQIQSQGRPKNVVTHRRIFIGPMPERVISHTETQINQKKPKTTLGSVFSLTLEADKQGTGDKVDEVARLVKAHAFRFFLHEGGDPNDWDEQQEDTIAEELLGRWKDSDWGRLWSHRHQDRRKTIVSSSNQWFGTSFEVGNLLGVDILQGGEHIHVNNPLITEGTATQEGPHGLLATRSITSKSFVSAKSPSSMSRIDGRPSKASRYESLFESPVVNDPETGDDTTPEDPTPASSVTGLLRADRPLVPVQDQKTKSQPDLRMPPKLQDVNRAHTEMPPTDLKGKARMVHYEDLLDAGSSSSPPRLPVPPEEVLNRMESSLDPNTSSAAAAIQTELALDRLLQLPDDSLKWGDIFLRDRMLVRANYSKDESITHFDEEINRTTRDLHYEDWGEFLVAWRRDSIEIYRDHNTPGREWLTGHKHLSYVIPLKSSRTKISLFSFVDMTFCITCAPTTSKLNTATSRWVFSREKEGTNIFIFKVKSRSRAYDWIWQLWRSMGGQLPPSIDVYNPRLSTKVTIDVPNDESHSGGTITKLFTRQNVIQLCMDSLHDVPDWKYVIDEQLQKGYSLGLAWRSKANIDWIWLEDDVTGKPREWAVLCGLPMKQLASTSLTLEIRLAYHAASHIHLKDGTPAREPPSIEGYLDRIRPNTQTKQSIYLSVHQGNMFLLNPLTASPPMPPGLLNISTGNLDAQVQTLRHSETRRETNQIMAATAVLDLRTIVAVRRPFQVIPSHMHSDAEGSEETLFKGLSMERKTTEDEADEGGDSGLAKSNDRTQVRMRRSFELLLKSGHVIRFEAYSSTVAIEWIDRLRALVFYWKLRHRTDAKQEIELAQAQRPRLTPQTRVHADDEELPPEPPADLSAPFEAMNSLYNWCVLEGCKSLAKTGRLYVRKGLRGQYKLVQLYLVAGHLIRFRINGHSSLYPAMHKKINLLDAYVCSGHLAAQCLPKGQYKPNAEPAPRRYQDGLETNDREEDMLFMIWYRPQPLMFNADQDPTVTPVVSKSVPSISSKNKMLVFRTRSILERDAWCWAINSEIEKIVRAQKSREDMLRQTGGLLRLRK